MQNGSLLIYRPHHCTMYSTQLFWQRYCIQPRLATVQLLLIVTASTRFSAKHTTPLSCCMRPVLGASLTLLIGRSYKHFPIDDFATLCSTHNKQLFNRILNQPEHILHSLLPPPSASQYNLRDRPHNRLLCQRASRLTDCNFIIRMLAISIDRLYVHFTALCLFHNHDEVRFDISVIKELID